MLNTKFYNKLMNSQNHQQSGEKTKQKKKQTKKWLSSNHCDYLSEVIGEYTVYFSQVIGEGTYGKVYKASKSGSQEVYACKFIKQEKIDNLYIYYHDKKMAQQLEKRLQRQGQFQMTLLEYPYITKMYHTQKTQKGFYFFMQFCETDLAKLLKKEGFFYQQVALKYFRQIIEGIKHIYQKNAFHRDLKPENFLLKNGTIKISDFGFVKIFTDIDKRCKSRRNRFETQSLVGTFRYMSPEILSLFQDEIKQFKIKSELSLESKAQQSEQISQNFKIENKYNAEKSDVWSLGIILYKMLYGKEPYDGKSSSEMIRKINQTKLVFPPLNGFPHERMVRKTISEDVISLIKRMLNPDQNKRISFTRLYYKFNSLLEERQKEKSHVSTSETCYSLITRSQILMRLYNKIIIHLYKDLSNFATLRQIGIENYTQFSYKIMTLIHEKRIVQLETQNDSLKNKSQQKKYVNQIMRQQIAQYHNIFYLQIKSLSNLKQDDNLQFLLLVVYNSLENYNDFDLLIKQIQLFLLSLLQLCCLQLGIIDQDSTCDIEDKVEILRFEEIVELKDDFLQKISIKIMGKQSIMEKKEQQFGFNDGITFSGRQKRSVQIKQEIYKKSLQ